MSLRRSLLALCVCFMPFFAAPARAAGGWLDLFLKESEALGAKSAEKKVRLYGASKALVIGIDAYTEQGWPKLSKAVEDAKAVKAALEKQGFAVTLLTDLASAGLDRAFKEFFVRDGADPEARLFVWFAGHGHTVDGEGYLVPSDAPSPKFDQDFRLKALSLRRFGEYMRDAKAKHVLAVFDSCFGGAVFQTARAAPPPAITYATALPVRQFVSSGEAEQEVSDDGEFRRLFVDALEGKEAAADPNRDSFITGAEMGQFLFDKVTNYTNKRQTPRWGKLNERGFDRGDFVFEKGTLAPPPEAPVAAAPASGAAAGEAAQGWALVKDSDDVAALEAFRKQYCAANAFYCHLAARRIGDVEHSVAEQVKELKDARAKAASGAEKRQQLAMLAEQEKARAEAERKAKEEAERKAKEAAEAFAPGKAFRDCVEKNAGGTFVCPAMVVVPAGAFTMGSNEGESNEKPPHKVTIAKPFAVGKYEVTFAEWAACVSGGGCSSNKAPGDEGWGRDTRPVIEVSWNDAKEYAAWLTKKTGATYRLLTEAEWEYAARGGPAAKEGGRLRYWWGDTASHDYANYGKDECCGGLKQGKDQWEHTAPVGQFPANPFGLHDLHGNVWEWVEDCYHASYAGNPPSDDSAWTTGACEKTSDGKDVSRVLRGGSWDDYPWVLRSAYRYWIRPDLRDIYLGVRLARTLTP